MENTNPIENENSSVSSEISPVSPYTQTIKKIFFLLLLLTVSILIYFTFSLFIKKESNEGKNIATQKEETLLNKVFNNNTNFEMIEITSSEVSKIQSSDVLEYSTNDLGKFTRYTSIENQEVFLNNLNLILERKDLDERTGSTVLLRKAIALSLVRSDNPKNIIDSNDILKILIDKKYESVSNFFIKDYALVTFLKSNFQNRLMGDVKRVFPEIYSKYADRGVETATLLSLIDISKGVSTKSKTDKSYVSTLIVIEAELINNHFEELKSVEKTTTLKDLERNVSVFPNTIATTFKGSNDSGILPLEYYAYGFDVYSRRIHGDTKIPEGINKKIDSDYELVFTMIKNSTSTDKIALNTMSMYNSIRYISSISKRYGSNFDKDKFDQIIKDAISAMNSSKETRESSAIYLKASVANSNAAENYFYFVSLGKERQDVHDYLLTIGIDIRK